MPAGEADPFPLEGIDHVEMYVGNARQAAAYWSNLGFRPVAYRGLETGSRDHASWCLEQGDARIVLTAALRLDGDIAAHVAAHGDGVRDIAFTVPDATRAFEHAVASGAAPVSEPRVHEDEYGRVVRAAIATYGDTIHSLIERSDYAGTFMPGYSALAWSGAVRDAKLLSFDHIVGAVGLGDMDQWVDFYRRVLGFSQLQHFSDDVVSTDYSALMSKVVAGGKGKIKFPICEPAQGLRKSQIDEFLDFYGSPGAQHLAFATSDIVASAAALQAGGVSFLSIPDTYYEDVLERVPDLQTTVEDLRGQGVLADCDEDGHLLQIFSRPLQDRPTMFLELIERHGARGFGEGNFKALFEALERAQAARGNL